MISLQDLNPVQATLLIKGKLYLVNPFTLTARVWVLNEFKTEQNSDGNAVLAERLRQFDLISAARVIYYLLPDKSDFTEAEFIVSIGNETKGHEKIFRCLSKVFGLSEPQIEQIVKEESLKKKEINWAEVYDIFAERYGYTLDVFYSLTNRQLHALLKAINKSKAEEFKFQAALAGKELEVAADEGLASSNPELDSIADAAMERFMKRSKK